MDTNEEYENPLIHSYTYEYLTENNKNVEIKTRILTKNGHPKNLEKSMIFNDIIFSEIDSILIKSEYGMLVFVYLLDSEGKIRATYNMKENQTFHIEKSTFGRYKVVVD